MTFRSGATGTASGFLAMTVGDIYMVGCKKRRAVDVMAVPQSYKCLLYRSYPRSKFSKIPCVSLCPPSLCQACDSHMKITWLTFQDKFGPNVPCPTRKLIFTRNVQETCIITYLINDSLGNNASVAMVLHKGCFHIIIVTINIVRYVIIH